jgi:holo-[acyl-carrier-protein] synthase
VRTGIDIVKIARIDKLVKTPKFVERVFDESELKGHNLAGIFALKEAFFKATQIKIKKWKEVVVKWNENGKPYLVYDENLVNFKINEIDCSIAHDGDYAVAIVVLK